MLPILRFTNIASLLLTFIARLTELEPVSIKKHSCTNNEATYTDRQQYTQANCIFFLYSVKKGVLFMTFHDCFLCVCTALPQRVAQLEQL